MRTPDPLPAPPALPAPVAVLAPQPPSPRIAGPSSLPVPILMYHVIGTAKTGVRYPGLSVPVGDFVAQLRYLVDHGYEAVTLRQVYDFWRGAGSLPRHPVVLSFDDGHASDYAVVAPLLDELRWPGVLNLIADRGPTTRMRTAEVRAMVTHGWEIDSHTVTHPNLTTLTPAALTRELTASRAKLQRLFGVPVDFFCYPSGRWDAYVVAAVRSAGYLAATTTDPGFARAGSLFTLRRVRVAGGESLANFAAEIRAAW